MLVTKEWKHQSFQTLPKSYFYTFGPGSHNFCMSPVGVLSEDRYSHVFGMESESSDWIWPDQEITKILVEEFKQVPEVKSICATFSSEEITILTLLESYDRDAREKVYEKELKICKFLHLHDFDFRVTSIDLVSTDELVRTGSHKIYWR